MEPSDHMLNEVAGGRLRAADADVGRSRERNRQRRLLTIAVILAVPALWLWFRILTGRAVDLTNLSLPTVDPFLLIVGIFSSSSSAPFWVRRSSRGARRM